VWNLWKWGTDADDKHAIADNNCVLWCGILLVGS
jgi:hypothetical protein